VSENKDLKNKKQVFGTRKLTMKMKKYVLSSVLLIILMAFFIMAPNGFAYQLLDLASGKKSFLMESAEKLNSNRLIIVGELHSNEEHHRMQLAVIKALHDAGVRVGIGLEMFRRDSQEDLDRWISGDISPAEFHKRYYDNWNYPWPAYGIIFEYARENKIPMVGLNVSREITQQVARKGFDSLSEEQRGKLEDVVCVVDETYMAFIRKAFGDHSHGKLDFIHFCEAQLVWDNIMAIHAIDYLKSNPERVMVLLTGIGHALKLGIPAQIIRRSDLPHVVMLPETPGYITPERMTPEDTDFLILK
jgi:uncharacterized iron-regulated protein